MATDALSERLSSKLHLQTKTVGEDRIRRAKEKDEDVAIFSMFPMEGDPKFRCCLGKDCQLGDPKKADPGEEKYSREGILFLLLIIEKDRYALYLRIGVDSRTLQNPLVDIAGAADKDIPFSKFR